MTTTPTNATLVDDLDSYCHVCGEELARHAEGSEVDIRCAWMADETVSYTNRHGDGPGGDGSQALWDGR